MYKNIFLFLSLCLIGSCDSDRPVHNKGSIRIAIDESIKPLIEAEILAYKTQYPETNIIPVYVPENIAINLVLQDSIIMAAVAREFNNEEKKILQKREIKYTPGPIALNGIALVRSKSVGDTTLSFAELKKYMTVAESGVSLIFDQSNSSGFNLIASKLGIKNPNRKNIFSAKGTLNVLEECKKDPNAIGFVGYNWLSDKDDAHIQKMLQGLEILAVSAHPDSAYYKINIKNLKARRYPFEQIIYLHTLSQHFGVENGFIRFCASRVGQLVIEKFDLVPYYIIPKEYIMNTETFEEQENGKKKKRFFGLF